MDTEAARQLLIKYNAGECTEAEQALVENSFLQYNEHEIDISNERIEEIGRQIYAELPIHHNGARPINLWLGAAAIAALALLSIGSWNLFDRYIFPQNQIIVKDVSPGSNKATITLDNGQTINLSGSKNGVVINGDDLTYLDGTSINETEKNSAIQMLNTPNGGQYQIVLSDGTKVWLNAASSLKYPTSFANAKERNVELLGEAYFEVAHKDKQPFIVKTPTQTVEVLGTQFNINNYNDDGVTITTLVQGSVKVTNESPQQSILSPNQQSLLTNKAIKVQEADIKTALAWKNGKIKFKDANIQAIMKQISRWYDIDVEFKGEVPDRIFNGSVSRTSNLSVVLKILAYSDIHFTIEKDQNSRNKLIVTP